MDGLASDDVLAIWDAGRSRHAIDRALLLFAAARRDLPAGALADLPIGERNRALLALRAATFGPVVRSYVACPACGDQMELTVGTDALLPPGGSEPAPELEIEGLRFRQPTSRDLASVVASVDEVSAALTLLERCCLDPPERPGATRLPILLERVEAGLASLDPAADIELALSCGACGHAWTIAFDVAAVLWDELDARARAVLSQVHSLALAYGWSERDILALSEERRAAYLGMILA